MNSALAGGVIFNRFKKWEMCNLIKFLHKPSFDHVNVQQGLVQDYSQRLIEGNIYRQKLSRLKLSRLRPRVLIMLMYKNSMLNTYIFLFQSISLCRLLRSPESTHGLINLRGMTRPSSSKWGWTGNEFLLLFVTVCRCISVGIGEVVLSSLLLFRLLSSLLKWGSDISVTNKMIILV